MQIARFIKGFFYGNYFYGICAVALAIECSVQLSLPLNSILFYLLLFSITVLYYTHAYYIESKRSPIQFNDRTKWYLNNQKWIEKSQLTLTGIIFLLLILMLNGLQPHFTKISAISWIILAIFLLLGAGYYKSLYPKWGNWGLRGHGLIKPLIIGATWAGMVSFAPVIFFDLSYPGRDQSLESLTWLLLLKNWLFISILCMLFDFKDYATDANQQLKTWVVKFGIRKTLYWIILPMSIISMTGYWLFTLHQSFNAHRILFNSIPYVLLITVSALMYQRKSILYYLAIIDGLMLAKAICGIIGMN